MTQEALKKVGSLFQGKREEMHLTLKEVENATSIRTQYLQAIEEGRIEQYLSNTYAIGFMRQYANFLGFDGDRMIKEHPEAFRLPPEKQDFAYGIGTLEMRGAPQNSARNIPQVVWIVGGGVILLIAWAFAKWLGLFS